MATSSRAPRGACGPRSVRDAGRRPGRPALGHRVASRVTSSPARSCSSIEAAPGRAHRHGAGLHGAATPSCWCRRSPGCSVTSDSSACCCRWPCERCPASGARRAGARRFSMASRAANETRRGAHPTTSTRWNTSWRSSTRVEGRYRRSAAAGRDGGRREMRWARPRASSRRGPWRGGAPDGALPALAGRGGAQESRRVTLLPVLRKLVTDLAEYRRRVVGESLRSPRADRSSRPPATSSWS